MTGFIKIGEDQREIVAPFVKVGDTDWHEALTGWQKENGVWGIVYSSGAIISFTDYPYPIPVMVGWQYSTDGKTWITVDEQPQYYDFSNTYIGDLGEVPLSALYLRDTVVIDDSKVSKVVLSYSVTNDGYKSDYTSEYEVGHFREVVNGYGMWLEYPDDGKPHPTPIGYRSATEIYGIKVYDVSGEIVQTYPEFYEINTKPLYPYDFRNMSATGELYSVSDPMIGTFYGFKAYLNGIGVNDDSDVASVEGNFTCKTAYDSATYPMSFTRAEFQEVINGGAVPGGTLSGAASELEITVVELTVFDANGDAIQTLDSVPVEPFTGYVKTKGELCLSEYYSKRISGSGTYSTNIPITKGSSYTLNGVSGVADSSQILRYDTKISGTIRYKRGTIPPHDQGI